MLLSIFGAAELTFLLTGRRPEMNMDWVLDYASAAVRCVLVILLTSVAKQALGSWLTVEDKEKYPVAHAINTATTLVLFLTIAYLFLH